MGCCCSSEDNRDQADASKPHATPFKRKNVCCTDIIMLILFIAFWGFMVYIAVYAIIRGDAKRLVYGYDSFGNTCNEDNRNKPIANLSGSGKDMRGMPYVFFFYVFDPFDSMQICVKSCPDADLHTADDLKNFTLRTGSQLCHYDVDVEEYTSQTQDNYGQFGLCPHLPIYNSTSIIQRCAPDPRVIANDDLDETRVGAATKFYDILNFDDLFRKVLSDFYSCWKEILVLCGAAVVLAFLMVLLIRYLAVVIVWIIVLLAALGSIAGTAFLWWTYYQAKQEQDSTKTKNIPILDIDIENKTAFLVFSIIATVLTVILLLILLVMRKRISLVVALFGEAGKAVAFMPILLVQPLWTFLIWGAFVVYWVIVLAFIATAGHPRPKYDLEKFVRVEYVLEDAAKHFWWVHLIGLIWTSEFILACQQFVIAGATAQWYFTREKNTLSCPVGKSVCRLILHHLGSVAFGSFIIVLVKIPRYILMYIKSKCDGSENACAKCCLKCCICCLWCLEKILKYINHNAYTIIAIDGRSFCPAAKKAFTTLTSNALRVAALNSVGAFVLFLGKIGVMAATCAISVLWLRSSGMHFYALPVLMISVFAFLIAHCLLSVYESLPHVHYYAIPVFFLCVFSFLIAHCFLSVYEMVIDSLLLCFCWDSEKNDGSPGREYYMSKSLMEFVNNSSKQIENMKGRSKDYLEATTAEEARELQDMRA